MSELKKLNDAHKKAIKELQNNCHHIPSDCDIAVKLDDGFWGRAILCSVCGKILEWTEEPTKQYETVAL